MNLVKDYISFAIWFIGLSYVALWPMAVPDSIAAWLAPQAPMSRACGGLVVTPLQDLCLAHEAVALSPGLHLIGTLSAFWVTARLMVLLVVLPLRKLLAAILPSALLWRARLKAALNTSLTSWTERRRRPEPPRYVPKRREFGLRSRSR